MLEQNIKVSASRIWQVCSHVRGLMPDSQLQQVAIAFTFLRRIDCLVGQYAKECASFYEKNHETLSEERLDKKLREISGGYSFYNYSGYTFSALLLSNKSVDVVLNTYLQGFSINVIEFLDGMNFRQNLGVLQRQSRYLVELFQLFAEIDLSASSVDNEEFIELVSNVFSGSREIGEFYTPLGLTKLISGSVLSEDIRADKEEYTTIYDPVCGTGGLLSITGQKAKDIAVHQSEISLFGQDIAVFPCAIAKALTLLSGNEDSTVLHGNTLTDDMFPNRRFHYIVAEFPFGLQWRPFKERIEKESKDLSGRFHIGLPSVSDSQLLFVEHIISKMDPNGSRAAFITSASALWSGNAGSGETRIRRWLFENDMVESIISLPSGVLSFTSIPVYLWILSNKKDDFHKGRVRLIDTTSIVGNERRFLLDEKFVKNVLDEYKSKVVSKMSKFVSNDDFGYYEVSLLENGKRKETVKISLGTDINEFIARERQPFAKGTVTVDYGSVEKGYSVQFEDFFATEETPTIPVKETAEAILSIVDAISELKPLVQKAMVLKETGSLPESWKELPLRSFAELIMGVNKPPLADEAGLPLLSVAYLRNPEGQDRYAVTPRTKCSTDNDVIVITKGANSGEVFAGMNGILSPSVTAIRIVDNSVMTPRYFYYLMKGYEKRLMPLSKGVSIKSIDSRTLLDFKFVVPPIEDQKRIVDYLDSNIIKIDSVMKSLKSVDNMFAVFRQSLIENVVLGKIAL